MSNKQKVEGAGDVKGSAENRSAGQGPDHRALKTRQGYERKGYGRRWVDKRLGGTSVRHELTAEWYRRGARESDQFRELTNRLLHGAFDMDVETYRRYKQLTSGVEKLRDHMSDLELALLSLAELTAAELHRAHNSHSFEQLRSDIEQSGEIVAQTRQMIESRSGSPIVQPGKGRRPEAPAGGLPKSELADDPKDMHNPSPSPEVRPVA
jgi:hypothetical protein